jgi:molybdopterin synthase catalytic subunit
VLNLNAMMAAIRNHPEFHRAGMILAHTGVVRGTSRDGRRVTGLRVGVDRDKLDRLIESQKQRHGIVEILVDIAADRDLAVGDDVMCLVVAGDVRENVLAVLGDTLNTIKTTVTQKTEFFIQTGGNTARKE